MRWPQCLILLGAMLATSGCFAQAQERSAIRSRPIIVGDKSNVCVSVHVDQRIWPRKLDSDSPQSFSESLMSSLRKLYLNSGGTFSVPGSLPPDRFITNIDGNTPSCQDFGIDVLIELRYRQRANGKPFVVDYTVSRGAARRQGSIDVNVAEEIRAGRLQGYNERRTDANIIVQDMLERALMIFKFLKI